METTPNILDQIRTHGAEAYPEEGCGFLLGVVTEDGAHRVTATRPAPNRRAERRERRYELTAEARPSETDLAEATFPGFTYVIVSVRDGAPETLTAWTLAPDRSEFTREEITVHPPETA
jgi:proteasome lid subunit RPN8/RPN11